MAWHWPLGLRVWSRDTHWKPRRTNNIRSSARSPVWQNLDIARNDFYYITNIIFVQIIYIQARFDGIFIFSSILILFSNLLLIYEGFLIKNNYFRSITKIMNIKYPHYWIEYCLLKSNTHTELLMLTQKSFRFKSNLKYCLQK